MELLKSFYYMFKCDRWYITVLTGILIFLPVFIMNYILWTPPAGRPYEVFIALLICSGAVTFLANFFINGYAMCNANTAYSNGLESIARWKNFRQIFLAGLKFLAALWIYCIPLFIVLVWTFCIYVSNTYELNGPYLPERSLYYLKAQNICNTIAIVISAIVPIAFVTDLKFKSFFNIKRIFEIIRHNFAGFCIYLVFAAFDCFAFLLLSSLIFKCPYITIPFGAVAAFYLLLVKCGFLAQIAIKTKPVESETGSGNIELSK